MKGSDKEKYRGLQVFEDLGIDEANYVIDEISRKNGSHTSTKRKSRNEFIAEMKFGQDLMEQLRLQRGKSQPVAKKSDARQHIAKADEKCCQEESPHEQPDDDIISETEWGLASRLKELCNANGEERKETLYESACVILEMGSLYVHKSQTTKGMRKKLNLLKAATLLHGARARFLQLTKTKDHEKCEAAQKKLEEIDKKDLPDLNEILIKSLPSRTKSGQQISRASKELSENLSVFRRQISDQLEALMFVPDQLDASETFRFREEKIEKIRILCEETTTIYVKLMKEVAAKCISIVGAPPCKFALAGLGSMSRKEITLYSDFEHVIVLDDRSTSDQRKYESIKEYFRWFAVVFQIIIIGLGETFIRSIGVKSINDLSSKEVSKNWFLDIYTPVGVAFDGMVPHSCNNPLGRQETTELRQHVVELIQPASKMALFLTREEELKNGYFLKDVLTGTCFVFGDEDVYFCFEKKAQQILDAEGMNERIAEQLKKIVTNHVDTVRGSSMLQNPLRNYDFKKTTYRPIAALLTYLARICDVSEKSSFEIVDRLSKAGILDSQWSHSLNFTVAVANEARMRVYLCKDGQRNASTPQDVAQVIGRTTAKFIFMVIRNLVGEITNVQCMNGKIMPFKPMDSTSSFEDWDLEAAANFGFFDEVVSKASKNISKVLKAWKAKNLTDASEANYRLARYLGKLQHAFMRMSHAYPDRRYDYFRKTEWACTRVLKLKPAEMTTEFSSLQYLTTLYFLQLRSEEGVIAADEWFKMYYRYNLTEGMQRVNVPLMRFMEVQMREDVMNEWKLITYLMRLLSSSKLTKGEKFFVEIGIASAELRKGNKEKQYGLFRQGKDKIADLLQDVKANAAGFSRLVYETLLETIRTVQEKHVLQQHLFETAQALNETQEDDYPREMNLLTDSARQMKIASNNFAGHADDHEYCVEYFNSLHPELRVRFEPMVAAITCQDIFAAFSYREMKQILSRSLKLLGSCMRRMGNDNRIDAVGKLYGVSMMVMFESSTLEDIQNVISVYRKCPNKIKYYGPLQSVLYGYISATGSRAVHKHSTISRHVLDIQLSQRRIVRSLTEIKGQSQFTKAFNAAVDLFTLFRFQECASIIWRILYRGRNIRSSIHLLNAVVIVCIVSRRHESVEKHVRQLREISHSQLIDASTMNQNTFTKSMGLRLRNMHITYGKGNLVQAHNLAVDCHPISVKKCARLLWKILFYEHMRGERRVKMVSTRFLIHVTYTECIQYLPRNLRQPLRVLNCRCM